MSFRTFATDAFAIRPDVFQRVLAMFPKGIQMAFAYGSGVFQQAGNEMSKNMLDFVFVVDNPEKWHKDNLYCNSDHYSFLKKFGSKYVVKIQEQYGARIYFNTLVPFEERLIKYGVIGTEHLLSDLTHWETLYVSGRLHKPVKIIKRPTTANMINAMNANLRSALHAALLQLPETFNEEQLYTKIAYISYSGDFRMKFGEDKSKVSNIVSSNISFFKKLYQPILLEMEHLEWDEKNEIFKQDQNNVTRFYHLSMLPKCVIEELMKIKSKKCPSLYPDIEEFIRLIHTDIDCPSYVGKSIANIVNKSSWSQSVKGLLTAGVTKSAKYSFAKITKMINGTRAKQK